MRAVIVYGDAPSGHWSCAQALGKFLEAEAITSVLFQVSRDINPCLGPVLAKLYLGFVRLCPKAWRRLSDGGATAIVAVARRVYWLLARGKIRAAIKALSPDIIICAHAAPLAVLSLEKKKRGLPCLLAACPTDLDIHPFWIWPEVDSYFAASKNVGARLIRNGIKAQSIIETGIPIHPAFLNPPQRSKARRDLGLPQDETVLLLSGGSRGLGSVKSAARRILDGVAGCSLIAVCGANRRLFLNLSRLAEREPRLRVFARASPAMMAEFLSAADLLIGKAGGVSAAEALAVGIPMILVDPLPGVEERNCDILVKEGCALRAASLEGLAEIVSNVLDNAVQMNMLRAAASRLGRPCAGQNVAQAVAGMLGNPVIGKDAVVV
ncbi:MAG: MGDG synthase family glycosyltransferase [Elusimicrobiota bacterium]